MGKPVKKNGEVAGRLDFFLDPPQAGQLAELMAQWDMTTRKEVVQHALDIVHQTVVKNRKAGVKA